MQASSQRTRASSSSSSSSWRADLYGGRAGSPRLVLCLSFALYTLALSLSRRFMLLLLLLLLFVWVLGSKTVV